MAAMTLSWVTACTVLKYKHNWHSMRPRMCQSAVHLLGRLGSLTATCAQHNIAPSGSTQVTQRYGRQHPAF